MNKMCSKLILNQQKLIFRRLTTTSIANKYASLIPDDISRKVGKRKQRKEWQKVRPRGYSLLEKRIHAIKEDETRLSNAELAHQVSEKKLQRLKSSLLERGFCRDCQPYKPPENLEVTLKSLSEDVIGEKLDSNWLDTKIPDYMIKFNLLTRCEEIFKHELVNSELHRIETLRDVYDYYSTPVRGISSYDQLIRTQDSLPGNMYVIPEPIRHSAEYFGGLDAYPNSEKRETRLRAKKKYPDLKIRVSWPDV